MLNKDLQNTIKSLSVDDLQSLKRNLDKYIADAEEREKPVKYITQSDIGCVLIGTEMFQLKIFNHHGDGDNEVYIFQNRTSWLEMFKDKEERYCYSVNGVFNLYDHDCANPIISDNILTTISGDYYIYVYAESYSNPKICFVPKEKCVC